MKYLKIFLSLRLTLLLISFLPPFIYNELEYHFRQNLRQAFISADQAEQGIEMRRNGIADGVSYEDMVAYGAAIEASISQSIQSLEKAQRFISYQDKMLFLVNGKYQNYHSIKQKAVSNYLERNKEFLTRKQNEHMTTNTLMLIANTQADLNDVEDYDRWWSAIEVIPQRNSQISNASQTLFDRGYIEKDLYDYFNQQRDLFQFMYEEAEKIEKAESWDAFDTESFIKLSSSLADLSPIFEKAQATWNQATDDYYVKTNANNIELERASDYYNDNKLAYDKISLIIEIFNNHFPRMKFIENSQPTLVPSDIDPDTISFRN